MHDSWSDINAKAEELGLQNVPMNELVGTDRALLVLEYYDHGLRLAKCLTMLISAMNKMQAGDTKGYIAAMKDAMENVKEFQKEIHKQAIDLVDKSLDATAAKNAGKSGETK